MKKKFIVFTAAMIVWIISSVLWVQECDFFTWHFPVVVVSGILSGGFGAEIWDYI